MNVKHISVGSFILSAFAAFALVAMRPTPAAASSITGPTQPAVTREVVIPAPEPIVSLPEVTIVGHRPAKKRAKKAYVCGPFERLENDVVQTVRRCEWR